MCHSLQKTHYLTITFWKQKQFLINFSWLDYLKKKFRKQLKTREMKKGDKILPFFFLKYINPKIFLKVQAKKFVKWNEFISWNFFWIFSIMTLISPIFTSFFRLDFLKFSGPLSHSLSLRIFSSKWWEYTYNHDILQNRHFMWTSPLKIRYTVFAAA